MISTELANEMLAAIDEPLRERIHYELGNADVNVGTACVTLCSMLVNEILTMRDGNKAEACEDLKMYFEFTFQLLMNMEMRLDS